MEGVVVIAFLTLLLLKIDYSVGCDIARSGDRYFHSSAARSMFGRTSGRALHGGQALAGRFFLME